LPEERSNLVTSGPLGLVDVLDRILDKGLVIVGDIKISLVSVELLTLKIRLIICSIDKAEQIGLDWWRYDPEWSGHVEGTGEVEAIDGAETGDVSGPEALAEPGPQQQVKPLAAPAEERTRTAAPPRKENGAARRGTGRARG